jgi:hypothetical protein
MHRQAAPSKAAVDVGAWTDAATYSLRSGAIAALATTAVVALAGARETGSAVAPINATSHIVWGESAGRVERVDARHTLLGAALNFGACVFWAAFYERWFGRAPRRDGTGSALLGGAARAAAAYVTDYHVIPRRLTPGWESRLSGRAIAAAYLALALSLPLRRLLRGR